MTRHCVQCNTAIISNGKNNNVKYCGDTCMRKYTYEKRKAIWDARNLITREKTGGYAKDKLQCPYCKKYYRKLASHTWQIHEVRHAELKDELGLDKKKGLIPESDKEILRKHVAKNAPLVVEKNLLQKGQATRFTTGHKVTYKRSEQTMKRLRTHIKQISKHEEPKTNKI